jgi:hypothetical protein
MRNAAVLATLTAASVLTATPALAGQLPYGNVYTYWNESSALSTATHTASAARTGAVSASASAQADRPTNWHAISSGTVVKTFSVGPNPYGYVVTATFTGISASSNGGLASGTPVVGGPDTTAADVSLNAHYLGDCMAGGAPCYTAATILDTTAAGGTSATVTFTLPGTAAKATIGAYAAAEAWLQPTPTGVRAYAQVSATVASITVRALTP